MSVQGTIYKVGYTTDNGRLLVRVLGRDSDGNRLERNLSGTEPYFYILANEAHKVSALPPEVAALVVSVTPGPPSMNGSPTARVQVRFPYDVPKVRTFFSWVGEADIVYQLRSRVDHRLTHIEVPDGKNGDIIPVSQVKPLEAPPQVTPRLLTIDIETNDADGKFSKPSNAYQPVLSVAFFDSLRRAYGIIYSGPPVDPEAVRAAMNRQIPEGKPKVTEPIRLFPVENEHDILGALGELLGHMEPDIVTGWNSYDYDFPYLGQRALRLLPSDPGSEDLKRTLDSFDVDIHKEPKYHGSQRTKGRYTLSDSMAALKKIDTRRQSLALESVAQKVLGYGKIPRPALVSDLRKKDLVAFLAYNAFDVLLAYRVDEKRKLTGFLLRIGLATNVEIPDTLHNSRIVDGALLAEARIAGTVETVLPSKVRGSNGDDFDSEGAEGGEVFPTVVGFHKWVTAFDESEEYPRTIRTYNISPETRGKDGPDAHHLRYDGHAGGTYCSSPPGLIPRALARFQALRSAAKAKAKRLPLGSPERRDADLESASIKNVTNSFYGVMGSAHWRLSNTDMVNDVTGMAREQLRHNQRLLTGAEWVRSVLGYPLYGNVVLGDTDSAMLVLHRDHENGPVVSDLPDLLPIVRKLVDAVNATYPAFVAQFGAKVNYTELALQGVWEVLKTLPKKGSDIGAAKRYFGLWAYENGEDVRSLPYEDRLEYKGIDLKRFNQTDMVHDVQKEVVRMVLTERPIDEVLDYVEAERKAVLAGERDEKLMVPTRLNKDANLYGRVKRKKKDEDGNETVTMADIEKPPYVRAILNYSRITGKAVDVGEEFKWFPVRGGVAFKEKRDEEMGEFAIPFQMDLAEARHAGFVFELDRTKLADDTVDGAAEKVCPELVGSTPSMDEVW